MSSKSFQPLGVVVVMAAALLFQGGCARQPAPTEEAIRPVVTYRVPDPARKRLRSFSGTIRPAMESELSFRVGGEIIELPVKPGLHVQKGDLIARLDSSDYALQVRQAEAQVSQADALFKQARLQHDRVRDLYESNNASKSELDQARAAFETAEAQLEAARKALEMARLQLNYCELQAPFNGKISSRPAERYQAVSPGQPIATLASGNELEMVIAMPEVLINRIEMGAPASITLDALPGRQFNAAVSEIGVEASGKSAYLVRLALQDMIDGMRIGMVGEARIAFATDSPDAVLIPPAGVVGEADGTRFVWIVDTETHRVVKRPVKIGALTSEGLQILDGLQPGELVVQRGMHQVAEGIKVKIMEL